MELAGTWGNYEIKYIRLTFDPCNLLKESYCAPEEEIRSFLATSTFSVYGLDNFVDLSEVNTVENSLNQVVKFVYFG